MVEIYINDELLDLRGDESIEVDYSIFDITKIGSRGGARSYEFELPKTNRNKQILENPEMVNNLSELPYSRMNCLILVDGVDVLIRFAEIASVKDYYSVRVYGSNSDFFNIMSNHKLIEIDFSDLDELWEDTTMVSARTRTEGIIYPVVDYHGDSPNAYINNDNKQVRVETLLPCIFVNDLLGRMFDYVGYTLVNEIEDDYELIMPLYNRPVDEVANAYLAEKYEGVFGMNSRQRVDYGDVNQFYAFDTVSGNTGTYYDLPYTRPNGTRCLTVVDDISGVLSFSIDVTFLETNYSIINHNSINIKIQVYNQFNQPYYVTPVSRAFYNNPSGSVNFSFDIPFMFLTYNIYKIQVQILNVDLLGGQHFFVESSSSITMSDVRFVGNVLIYGEMLNIALLVPDITFGEFIKNYMLMFGIIPTVNETTKTVTFSKYNILSRNISLAYDWSEKVDSTEIHELTYIIDKYGQRNNFSYTTDGDEVAPEGTNGTINIDNINLEFEKDIVKLDFASSNYVTRLEDNLVTQVPVYEEGEFTSELSPRILYLVRLSSTDIGGSIVYATDTSQTAFNDNIGFGYFINPTRIGNLGFGNSLIPDYYDAISDILGNVKVVSLPIRLSAADISQLDFTRPVYIQKFESYFYISAVKGFTYTDNRSTLVELVKLNING